MNMGWLITILGIILIGVGMFLTYYGQHIKDTNQKLDANTIVDRPRITVIDSKCTGKLIDDNKKLQIKFNVEFKNIGRHAAENLRMRTWAAPVKDPNQLRELKEHTLANIIPPEGTFSWNPTFTVRPKEGQNFGSIKRNKMFIYIRFDYRDTLKPVNEYDDDLYVLYAIGSGSAGHATAEVKEVFQKYIDQLKTE